MLPYLSLKKFKILLYMIAMTGMLLRIVSSYELARVYPPVTQPTSVTDMYTYQKLAKDVLSGEYDYRQGFYYQPFYYVVFLPLVFSIGGENVHSVIIAQSLLGALVIWIIGIVFANLFGKWTGILAALITAGNRMLIFYTSFTLIEILQSFWISLMFYLTVIAIKKSQPGTWLILGLVTGCAITTRGNIILFMPLSALFIFYIYRNKLIKFILILLLYMAGSYLPQLPFAMVNYRAVGTWVGASTAGPAVLALGNTPESPPGGRDPDSGPGPMEYPISYHEWVRLAQLSPDKNIPISHSIWKWVKQEPGAYCELKLRMMLLFWNHVEIPNNVALSTNGVKIPAKIVQHPMLVDFILIGTLSLVGISILATDKRWTLRCLIPVFFVGIYSVAVILFYMLARFRLPIIPILCGLSGFAILRIGRICWLWRYHHLKIKSILYHSIILTGSYLVVAWGYDLYRSQLEPIIIRWVRPQGVQLDLADQFLIKDHGPQSFGGWQPIELKSGDDWTKFLILPQAIMNNEILYNPTIRLLILSQEQTNIQCILNLEGTDNIRVDSHFDLSPGLNWREIKTENLVMYLVEPRLAINFFFPSITSEIYLVFDTQRWYNRTTVNGKVNTLDGELIVELVIDKSQNH